MQVLGPLLLLTVVVAPGLGTTGRLNDTVAPRPGPLVLFWFSLVPLLVALQVLRPLLPYALATLVEQHEQTDLHRGVDFLLLRSRPLLLWPLLPRLLWLRRPSVLHNLVEDRTSLRAWLVLRLLPLSLPVTSRFSVRMEAIAYVIAPVKMCRLHKKDARCDDKGILIAGDTGHTLHKGHLLPSFP